MKDTEAVRGTHRMPETKGNPTASRAPGTALFALALSFALSHTPGLASGEEGRASEAGIGRTNSYRVVDDLGHPLEAFQLCFQFGSEMDCHEGQTPFGTVPENATAVRVETPEHGPVFVPVSNAPEAGELVVVVPRKGIVVVGPGEGSVLALDRTLRAYSLADAFRQPRLTAPLKRTSDGALEARLPVGEWLVSVSTPGLAPALHELIVDPGQSYRLPLRDKPGWSLVTRVTDDEGRPVAGAKILLEEQLSADPTYALSQHLARYSLKPASDSSGRVVFPGLSPGGYAIRAPGQPLEEPALGQVLLGPSEVREVALELQHH